MDDLCPICNLSIEDADENVWKCIKDDKLWYEHVKCQKPRWNPIEDFKEKEVKPKK